MTGFSTTWLKVIFRVKWNVFVSRWCKVFDPRNRLASLAITKAEPIYKFNIFFYTFLFSSSVADSMFLYPFKTSPQFGMLPVCGIFIFRWLLIARDSSHLSPWPPQMRHCGGNVWSRRCIGSGVCERYASWVTLNINQIKSTLFNEQGNALTVLRVTNLWPSNPRSN